MLEKLINDARLYIKNAVKAESAINAAFWYGQFIATTEAIELIDIDTSRELHTMYSDDKRRCYDKIHKGIFETILGG